MESGDRFYLEDIIRTGLRIITITLPISSNATPTFQPHYIFQHIGGVDPILNSTIDEKVLNFQKPLNKLTESHHSHN
jgi:hypothetical protein